MPETDLPLPNKHCAKKKGAAARRWLITFVVLLLLLILAWFGWEQYQLIQRQAAAPVISIAEDGSVRINGREFIIGPDGLPPKVLEEVLGVLPVECGDPFAPVRVRVDGVWVAEGDLTWSYPGTGLSVSVSCHGEDGVRCFQPRLGIGQAAACWLELRGQRWWLGEPGPLGLLEQRQLIASLRHDHHGASGFKEWWAASAGGAEVTVCFYRYYSRWHLGGVRYSYQQLSHVGLRLPPVYDFTGGRAR